MPKINLGRTWKEIQEGDRKKFTVLVMQLLENIHIDKIERYSGQEIDLLGERVKGRRAQISTTIDNNGEKIPVDYIMNFYSSKWMVHDIKIES